LPKHYRDAAAARPVSFIRPVRTLAAANQKFPFISPTLWIAATNGFAVIVNRAMFASSAKRKHV